MSTLTNQKGSVMYVCRNVSQNYLALRYDGAAVIVTGDLLRSKDFLADDIIEFDANPIGRADAVLYNTVKPKWKASRIKFLKHAEQWKGTAKVVTMDAQGEYCFLEGKDPKGVNYNIFCTRISVLPAVDKLGSLFSTGSTVRVICKEQVATPKNNNVKWRTVAATDLKHDLRVKAGAPLNSYEVIDFQPVTPAKPVPKQRIAPITPRPATAAAAVKSTPLAAVQTAADPAKDLTSLTIAQVVVKDKPPQPMPSPISPPTPTTVSEKASFAPCPPPGLPAVAPAALSSLPIPSYEWMKFDLISTIREKYPTSPENDLQDENRKLREISHHLSQGNCFCLSH